MSRSDHVIALDGRGGISAQGTFESLYQQDENIERLLSAVGDEPLTSPASEGPMARALGEPVERIEASADLSRKMGDWRIYNYYFRAAGWMNTITFLLASAVVAFTFNFPSESI